MSVGGTVLKTIVCGLAGLYVIEHVANPQTTRSATNAINNKVSSLDSQMAPLYETRDKAIEDLRKNIYTTGEEASEKAMSLFDDAYNKVVEAKQNLDSEAKSVYKFWAKPDANQEKLKKKYEEALKNFENFKKQPENYILDLDSDGYSVGGKVHDALNKAHDFALSKYHEITNPSGYQVSVEDRLRENLHYYKQAADDAKADWDQTRSSWFEWRRAQSKEVQDRAKAKYELLKSKNEEAIEEFINFLTTANEETQNAMDEAKKTIQENADYAKHYAAGVKDRVAQAGYDAKDRIDSDAEYAKHYAAGAKDRVAQAGYNAKENVKENAEYAKHYAAGAKDLVAQAGYDAKNQLDDNAEYAKHYAAGAKDRVAQAGYNAKENVKENAEYAKHYAAGVKDRVAQAGYDAKDRIDSDAEYAKHYAAGAKDRVAQAGYDAKNKLDDNAEYAKHYAAGVKDRVAQAGYDAKDKLDENIEEDSAQINEYINKARDWVSNAGSVTKDFLNDKYYTMWNSLGVFQVHSKQIAEEAVAYYDAQLEYAKKEYDNTQSSWLRWRSAKSQEIQDQAKAKWEIIKAKDDAARQELQRWKNL